MVTGHVSPLPPPNRTCDVHRLRLSGDWRLPAYAVIGSSFIDAAQFTSATRTSPRDLRRIGRRTSSPWPPSPWGRRSRPRTTMGPPTRWYVIGGLAPLRSPTRASHVHLNRLIEAVEVGVLDHPNRSLRFPSGNGGSQVHPFHP